MYAPIWLKRTALLVLFSFTAMSVASAQTPQQTQSPPRSSLVPASAEVLQVTSRRSDSVLNGALIGAGVAIAAGLFVCTRTEPWENCRDDVGPMLRIGALGAGIGIGIDALIRGSRTTSAAPPATPQLHAAPVVGRRAGGVVLSLSF